MNPRSIQFRLSAWYTLVLAIAYIALAALMYLGMEHHLQRNLRSNHLRRAAAVAAAVESSRLETGSAEWIQIIQERFAPEQNSRFVRITRQNGSVLYTSGPPADSSFAPQEIPLVPVDRPRAWVERRITGAPLLLVSETTGPGSGSLRVEVGSSLAPIQSVLRDWLLTFALVFPLVLAAAVAGGTFLAKRALDPVRKLIQAAERISSKNPSERLPVPNTGDELERLSTTLNQMLAHLDEALKLNRRFMADASHELRTPLAVVRGELESLLQNPASSLDPAERIASALEEVERLARIVEQLFALSRLDAGEAQAECVTVDLAQLAVSTADQMSLLAEDKSIALRCNSLHPVYVEGDRARLKQVAVNLLDNAIKYTPTGGSVTLSVQGPPETATAILEVRDTGIGIPASAIPHVFDRFYRVDKARSRQAGGAGIGLSIVKAICLAHNGEVEVSSEEGRGSRFCISLPAAQPPTNPPPPPQPAMHATTPPKSSAFRPTSHVLLLTIALLFIGCSRTPAPGNAAGEKAIQVAVTRAIRTNLVRVLTFNAELRPFQDLDVHAKIAGFVKALHVDVGDHVTAGQLLATLDVPELAEDIDRARAGVRRAEKEVARSREDARRAAADIQRAAAEVQRARAAQAETRLLLNRISAVFKERPGLVARQEVDAAEAKAATAEAQVAAAEAAHESARATAAAVDAGIESAIEQVHVVEADLKKLEAKSEFTRITAPFDGIVSKRYADAGDVLRGGLAPSAPAVPLVRLAQDTLLRVVFPISSSHVTRIKPGQSVTVAIAQAGLQFTNKLTRVAGEIEASTRSMEAQVDLPNPNGVLAPGLMATVSVALDRRDKAIAVPVGAVSRSESPDVLVVSKDGTLVARPVVPGIETSQFVEILRGLEESELVFIGSRTQARAGQRVEAKIVEPLAP